MLKKIFIVSIFMLFASCLNAQSSPWKLVWHDEFNYKGLPDAKKWSYDTGGNGWGNNELEYYTSKRSANARVQNGLLIIEARKEKWKNRNYTSARLVTKGKGDWKYGRIVTRAKLPSGRGTWPAIWMLASTTPLAWPDDGEIDIMEHVGFDQGNIHGSIHCKKYNHVIHTQKTDSLIISDCSSTFHDYILEWDSTSISIFVDEKKYFTFKNEHTGYEAWPFEQPFHFLLNIAVGGFWGAAKGVDENIWPQKMEIYYVRVYKHS